jgi:hypothetical protein
MDQQQPEEHQDHGAIVPSSASPQGAYVPEPHAAAGYLPGTPPPGYAPQNPQFQQYPPPPYAPPQYHPQPIYVTQQVQMAPAYVTAIPPKSMAASLLLTFFFGPFGLFYASVTGGIVMLIATFVGAALTFGVSLFVTWPICMIWAAVATTNYNARLMGGTQNYSQNAPR